jgi:methionine-gamma-lyase
VDINNIDEVRLAVRAGETKVLYVETMSNPTLEVADIPALAAVAREKGVKLVVDNTFTPMVVSPARLGADVVVHSVSKFISGGADVIAGKFDQTHRYGHKRLGSINIEPVRVFPVTVQF